ncbi:hypothetical protein BC835DRAFT_1520505 [Cytidiella melzeri]|nr:hypothetical protein BC835DRAFT_1520505 [Cytidiella melzeri]
MTRRNHQRRTPLPSHPEQVPLSNLDLHKYTHFGATLLGFPSAGYHVDLRQQSILPMTERALTAIAKGFSSVLLRHTGGIDSLATILDTPLTTAFPLCYDGDSTKHKTKKRKRDAVDIPLKQQRLAGHEWRDDLKRLFTMATELADFCQETVKHVDAVLDAMVEATKVLRNAHADMLEHDTLKQDAEEIRH